jgi:hypothetical protein
MRLAFGPGDGLSDESWVGQAPRQLDDKISGRAEAIWPHSTGRKDRQETAVFRQQFVNPGLHVPTRHMLE